jgi:hypothetical protein
LGESQLGKNHLGFDFGAGCVGDLWFLESFKTRGKSVSLNLKFDAPLIALQ